MDSSKAFLQSKDFFLLYNHKWALPIIVSWGMVWPMPRFSSHDILIYFPSIIMTAKRFSLSENNKNTQKRTNDEEGQEFSERLNVPASPLAFDLQITKIRIKKTLLTSKKDVKLESLNFKLKQYQKRASHQKSLEYSVFIPKNLTV